jgi:hypothetical protein
VLYHLATATAAVALGGTGARTLREPTPLQAVRPVREATS